MGRKVKKTGRFNPGLELQGRPVQKKSKELFPLQVVPLHELINTALRIDHRLLPREIGVASGTRVHVHSLFGRTRFDHIAAGTGDRRVFVLRMNVTLHSKSAFRQSTQFTSFRLRLSRG